MYNRSVKFWSWIAAVKGITRLFGSLILTTFDTYMYIHLPYSIADCSTATMMQVNLFKLTYGSYGMQYSCVFRKTVMFLVTHQHTDSHSLTLFTYFNPWSFKTVGFKMYDFIQIISKMTFRICGSSVVPTYSVIYNKKLKRFKCEQLTFELPSFF